MGEPVAMSAVEGVLDGLGNKIREVRQQRGLSLQQLASRSGVSAAAIHRMEHGNMVPTITTLMKVAAALNRPVSFFVNEQDPGRPVMFIPAHARPPVFTSKEGLELRSVSGPYGHFLLAGAMAEVSAGANSGPTPMEHPGEELIHLLEGALEVIVQDEAYLLGPGDSLHFRTDRPHRWANPDSAHPARALWMAFRTR